jgi:hypothetical protein
MDRHNANLAVIARRDRAVDTHAHAQGSGIELILRHPNSIRRCLAPPALATEVTSGRPINAEVAYAVAIAGTAANENLEATPLDEDDEMRSQTMLFVFGM